ncbi:MAG: 3-deoxy-D-manno-octulosonic acid transferase [Bacteroidaceae bacterium]|nr:3-deoxy-D-manno-octulosonic acid transferase [Bacteroidaceae bacterium]
MYTLGIFLYIFVVRLVALFGHKKARLKLAGHKQTLAVLKENLRPGENYVWFHVSSRAGFEQSRPMIERLRMTHPEYRIVLTFFSPSGYDMAKNYQQADVVCFLPFDTRRNIRKFLDLLQPKMVFFIKCEFWLNFLTALKERSIPVYSISAVFSNKRSMLSVAGARLRLALHCFTHIFVQDEKSKEVLKTIGIHNVSVVGNTRFDRVVKVFEQAHQLPLLEAFAEGRRVFVAGASERDDEAVFIPYFNRNRDWKLVIVPNKFNDERIKAIEKQYAGTCVRYTRATMENIHNADCVIVDCFGLLSKVYKYGDIAFVGGSFGKGVHNVLEAAVYGVPVLIGPENNRSCEAQSLMACGGIVEALDAYDFGEKIKAIADDADYSARIGVTAGNYVKRNAGVTAKIFNEIERQNI